MGTWWPLASRRPHVDTPDQVVLVRHDCCGPQSRGIPGDQTVLHGAIPAFRWAISPTVACRIPTIFSTCPCSARRQCDRVREDQNGERSPVTGTLFWLCRILKCSWPRNQIGILTHLTAGSCCWWHYWDRFRKRKKSYAKDSSSPGASTPFERRKIEI